MLDKMMFGQVARQMGLVDEEKLEECLEIQRQLQGMGINKPIGEILLEKKYLSGVEVLEVLNSMAKEQGAGAIQGYEIVRKLGQGGMGEVYKARDKSTGEIVAVKIVDPESADKESLKRFAREAEAAGKLNHPNIVRAHDVGESFGYHYFVMEYVEGPTVKEVLEQKGQLDEREAVGIAMQMARALAHAWQFNLVHRDIKPSNIMIHSDGTAKLCDFGLAKESNAAGEVTEVTQVGVVMGTPYYLSPEQARSEDLDCRSDIYSLGVTLYHMLAGAVPFTGESVAVIMYKHIFMDAPSLKKKNFLLSDKVCEIINKSMAKKKEDRYQTPDEFAVALEDCLKSLDQVGGSKAQKALTIRTPWFPVFLGATVFVISIVIAYFQHSADDQGGLVPANIYAELQGDLPPLLPPAEFEEWQAIQKQKKTLLAENRLGEIAELFGERYIAGGSAELKSLLLPEFDRAAQEGMKASEKLRQQAEKAAARNDKTQVDNLQKDIEKIDLGRIVAITSKLELYFQEQIKAAQSRPR